jgi:hypothetical protein
MENRGVADEGTTRRVNGNFVQGLALAGGSFRRVIAFYAAPYPPFRRHAYRSRFGTSAPAPDFDRRVTFPTIHPLNACFLPLKRSGLFVPRDEVRVQRDPHPTLKFR